MNRSQITPRLAIAFILLLALFVADSVQACPTCKDSLSENNKELIQVYFWSIMFMMAMPFSVFTGISTYFYLLIRKKRKSVLAKSIADEDLTEAVDSSEVVEDA